MLTAALPAGVASARAAPTASAAVSLARLRRLPRPRPELCALLILALVLDLWALGRNGWALLVLCSVAAVWCLIRALERGRSRWPIASGALVGLGFEAKMGAALLLVPGLVAAWLWVAPRGRRAAIRQPLASGGALLVVGGACRAVSSSAYAGLCDCGGRGPALLAAARVRGG